VLRYVRKVLRYVRKVLRYVRKAHRLKPEDIVAAGEKAGGQVLLYKGCWETVWHTACCSPCVVRLSAYIPLQCADLYVVKVGGGVKAKLSRKIIPADEIMTVGKRLFILYL
jgi:hypothetical protein